MSNNERINCWLDCDPGHDDSFAILLASYTTDKINVIGMSTVAGNQTIEKTTLNALNVMNLLGHVKKAPQSLSFPLIKGCGKPLMRKAVICDEIHGESGLETHGSIAFPLIPNEGHSHYNELNETNLHFTTVIYEQLKAAKGPVTVIATGPLTNIALLLINYPNVNKYIEKIVFMGGAIGSGNTGPAAEFNIQVDPEAAHIVFESDIFLYMVPLEVTHEALVTPSVLESIMLLNTNFSQIVIDLLLFFKLSYKKIFRMEHPPLHDPCAVAFVIDPNMFEYRLMRVDVETTSILSYGQTVCDIYDMSKKKKNVHVCTKMNNEKFWSMMIECMHLANKQSPINNIQN